MNKQMWFGIAGFVAVVSLYIVLFMTYPTIAGIFLMLDCFGFLLYNTASHIRTDIPLE